MLKIPKVTLDCINSTPELSSYLYDLNLLPEQIADDHDVFTLVGCYLMYKRMKCDGQGS